MTSPRTFIAGLATLLVAVGIYALVRHWIVQGDDRQGAFLSGHLPTPRPDGPCTGWIDEFPMGRFWRGKRFDASNASGINMLAEDSNGTRLDFPFRTWIGPGLLDPEVQVLKIDYDLPINPWWLRFLLDEIVEVEPGLFLGKLINRFFPARPLAMGYFWLRSQSSPETQQDHGSELLALAEDR